MTEPTYSRRPNGRPTLPQGRRVLRTRAFASLLATFGLFAAPALAQDPDSVVAIEPIMVRVLGSSIETGSPYSVSVVAGEELTRGTMSTFIDDAVRAIPGVQIQNRFNLSQGERIMVRGYGARAQFGVRGLRILVDGIPATLPDGQSTLDHLDLAGLGRVEALRGPSAALYGNAAGGVLHFRSLDPSTVPATVGVRWSGGTLGSARGATPGSEVSHGMWSLSANANGTAGSVGYRVGVTHTDFDGFRRDTVANDGSVYGAGVRTNVNALASMGMAGGTLSFVVNAVDLDAENAGSLPQSLLDEGDRAAWPFSVSGANSKQVQQAQLGASWFGPLAGTDAELAAWGVTRDLFNPIPGRIVDLGRFSGGTRALLRGSTSLGDGLELGLGGGVEAEFQSDDRLNYENQAGTPGDLLLDQDETVWGLGTFVQARLDIGSRLSVLAGGRYDRVSFSADDHFVGGGDPDDSGERTMDAFSPSAGVVVTAARDVEVFGSVSRSFETPSTTELANRPTGAGGFNPDLDPETGTTFEGGVRATVAQRLRLEASLFRTNFKNQLVPFEVPTDPGRTYYRNAGESRQSGWEVAADWAVGGGLSTRIAYTRVNAEFVDFVVGPDDFSGNKVPGVAPGRVDALAMFARGIGFAELRGIWQDDIPVNDAGTATAESYVLVDARVGLRDVRTGRFSVEPFLAVANVFDTDYVTSVVPNAFGARYFEPGLPRTFRVGLGVTWGPR